MCPNAGNAEAAKVCYDHCISITFANDTPPPLYLCIECANEIHREHPNQMFFDILHPMQQVSMICENKVSPMNVIGVVVTHCCRIVGRRTNPPFRYVFRLNVLVTMVIIRLDTASSATIIAIITEEEATTLFTGAYHPRGVWMQRCKRTWWRRL